MAALLLVPLAFGAGLAVGLAVGLWLTGSGTLVLGHGQVGQLDQQIETLATAHRLNTQAWTAACALDDLAAPRIFEEGS